MKQIQLNHQPSPDRNVYQGVAPGKPGQTKGILTSPKSAMQPEAPWWPAEWKSNACPCTVSSLLKNNPTRACHIFNLPRDARYDGHGGQVAEIWKPLALCSTYLLHHLDSVKGYIYI